MSQLHSPGSSFKQLQKDHYEELAPTFDSDQNRENRNHLNKIAAIAKFLTVHPSEKVLEIGVGTGIHAYHLLKDYPCDFTGADISEDMLKVAEKRLNGFEKVELLQMDGENLEFGAGTFDKVYISGSLHHYYNPHKGVQEIIRVLKPGGKFCVMEPNYLFPTNMYAAHTVKAEKQMKFMRISNFNSWLDQENVKYTITNFAYTPPFPKALIHAYNLIDKALFKMPLLRRISVMLFVTGEKLVEQK